MKRARGAVGVDDTVELLCVSLRGAGSNERKEADRRYLKMKAEQKNYGVPVPRVTELAKAWYKEHKPPLQQSAALLWSNNNGDVVYEHRLAAVKLMRQHLKKMGREDLPFVERCLQEAGTWALVDELATHVAPVIVADQEDPKSVLAAWSRSDNFWIRRSCLLAHLEALRSGGGDWESFTGFAALMLHEKEFFIQKAIGWVLRDTSRKRPQIVFEFALQHASNLSTVTHREAVKYLTQPQKAQIAAKRQ